MSLIATSLFQGSEDSKIHLDLPVPENSKVHLDLPVPEWKCSTVVPQRPASSTWSWNDASPLAHFEHRLLSTAGVPFRKAFVQVSGGNFINTVHFLPNGPPQTQTASTFADSLKKSKIESSFKPEINSNSNTRDEYRVEKKMNSSKNKKSHPNNDTKKKPVMVLLPGFGSGLGFWCANINHLVEKYDLWLIDLPGFGGSGRPRLDFQNQQDAEDFVVRSINEWRRQVGLDSEKFILAGHSFGGYLSAVYAMRHADHLHHLALIDPWGLEGMPEEVRNPKNLTWRSRLGRYVANSSPLPLSIMRFFGKHYAPDIIGRLRGDLIQKFKAYASAETLTNYIYLLNADYPTGEKYFDQFREGLAWPKVPLGDRLLSHFAENPDSGLSLSFVFGQHTWMSKNTGWSVSQQLTNCLYSEVPQSGHHLYVDNSDEFARLLTRSVDTFVKSNDH